MALLRATLATGRTCTCDRVGRQEHAPRRKLPRSSACCSIWESTQTQRHLTESRSRSSSVFSVETGRRATLITPGICRSRSQSKVSSPKPRRSSARSSPTDSPVRRKARGDANLGDQPDGIALVVRSKDGGGAGPLQHVRWLCIAARSARRQSDAARCATWMIPGRELRDFVEGI